MTEPGNTENLGNEAEQARAAVESGEHIREVIRNITLAALSRGQLDAEQLKRVVRSVMQGASMGVADAGEKSRLALKEAMAGIDEALAKSVEATKLAVEEAAGRLQDFGKRDLERSFNNMRVLESMFLDTLKDVARHSAGAAQEVLNGLLLHAQNSGTAAGAAAASAIASLEQKLGRTLHEVAAAGREAALNTGANLADAASGLLAGIADTLQKKAQDIRSTKK